MPLREGDDLKALEAQLRRLEGERSELRARIVELETRHERMELQQQDLLQTQRDLETSHDHYADLYDFAPIPYVTLDQNGLLRAVNLTTVTLLGYARSDLVDRPLRTLVADPYSRAVLDHLRRCRSGESPVRTELHLVSGQRQFIPVEVISRPLRSAGKVEFRSILFDLSDRVGAELERRKLQDEAILLQVRAETARVTSDAKDRFLAMLSHELRTPLTPILATIDLLEKTPGLPAGLTPAISLIRRNVEAEARLVDDLLDVGRITGGKLNLRSENTDLHALTTEVIEDARPQASLKQIALDTELTARQIRVHADPYRLKQVVRNLVENAIKFSPSGGRIVARTDNPRAEWIRLEIADDGIGLSRDQLARIFLPFEQAGAESEALPGLGLGLAIAKGIIEAHDGSIHAYSAGPGRGARFAFELETSAWMPLAPPPRAKCAEASRTRSVLLVEDHADSAEALCLLLECEGYRVRVATSIAAAVACAADECDVLVSDLQLPDGSGHSLLARLPRQLPAIAVSGSGAPDDIERSREAGFVDHLVKPVSGERLLAAIERALGSPA